MADLTALPASLSVCLSVCYHVSPHSLFSKFVQNNKNRLTGFTQIENILKPKQCIFNVKMREIQEQKENQWNEVKREGEREEKKFAFFWIITKYNFCRRKKRVFALFIFLLVGKYEKRKQNKTKKKSFKNSTTLNVMYVSSDIKTLSSKWFRHLPSILANCPPNL